jgi:hypothetical protein
MTLSPHLWGKRDEKGEVREIKAFWLKGGSSIVYNSRGIKYASVPLLVCHLLGIKLINWCSVSYVNLVVTQLVKILCDFHELSDPLRVFACYMPLLLHPSLFYCSNNIAIIYCSETVPYTPHVFISFILMPFFFCVPNGCFWRNVRKMCWKILNAWAHITALCVHPVHVNAFVSC